MAYKYQIKIFQIMIVDSIVALIEQDVLVVHNHDELALTLSYTTRYLFFAFNIDSMFTMHLSSN